MFSIMILIIYISTQELIIQKSKFKYLYIAKVVMQLDI